ncbi:MAG: sigma-70 family RNA polymerase sigma factor [Sandaracinaceae bacterium]|nr:sigma-70 family RNA polymerase sigma factor [Sandaracinaceae bacterium]
MSEGELRAAGALLVRGYADEVHALCRAMVRDATLAEDLSQEVFVRAFDALAGFRGDASVRTWILRIARNRCIDELRARRRALGAEGEEPDAHATEEPDVADLLARREDVRAGLDALDERERALVVLRFGHELGYPELSDAFGVPEGAVRMRISRAVAKMRAAIEAPAPPPLGAIPPPAAAAPAAPRLAARALEAAPARGRRRRILGWLGIGSGDADEGAAPTGGAPGALDRRAEVELDLEGLASAGAHSGLSPFAHPAPASLRARLAELLTELRDQGA